MVSLVHDLKHALHRYSELLAQFGDGLTFGVLCASLKFGIKAKRLKAGWSEAILLKVLQI